MKKIIIAILVLSQSSIGFSSGLNLKSSLADDQFKSRISEYFYSPNRKALLIPIKILGSVGRPGLYHVPANTSLTTLLSISGGGSSNADLNNIIINNIQSRKNDNKKTISLSDLMTSGKDISLKSGDIVLIEKEEEFFDQKTVVATSVITSILGILITGYLASKN